MNYEKMFREAEIELERRRKRLTYVYAMQNERNGYIKIGRSHNPYYRESTLQSEEPEVALLFAYRCEPEMEIELHQYFSDRRLRGEWFALSEHDVFQLHLTLKCAAAEFDDAVLLETTV